MSFINRGESRKKVVSPKATRIGAKLKYESVHSGVWWKTAGAEPVTTPSPCQVLSFQFDTFGKQHQDLEEPRPSVTCYSGKLENQKISRCVILEWGGVENTLTHTRKNHNNKKIRSCSSQPLCGDTPLVITASSISQKRPEWISVIWVMRKCAAVPPEGDVLAKCAKAMRFQRRKTTMMTMSCRAPSCLTLFFSFFPLHHPPSLALCLPPPPPSFCWYVLPSAD